MTILSSRPTAKSPKGKAAKAARKAEEASWWTQPLPVTLSLGDAGKVDDRKPRLVAVPDDTRANLWPTNVQLGQHLAELFEAGQADKLPEVARSCGVSIDDALTALRDHLVRVGMLPADSPIGVRTEVFRTEPSANHPAWCSVDHIGELIESGGMPVRHVHEHVMAKLVSLDPATTEDAATAIVMVETVDEEDGTVRAPRVVVAIADDDQGGNPGEQGVQGWSAPTERVRAFAAALVAACDLVDGK